jgi:hypothetical protein
MRDKRGVTPACSISLGKIWTRSCDNGKLIDVDEQGRLGGALTSQFLILCNSVNANAS